MQTDHTIRIAPHHVYITLAALILLPLALIFGSANSSSIMGLECSEVPDKHKTSTGKRSDCFKAPAPEYTTTRRSIVFETEYIEDGTLAVGQTRIVQEGFLGSKELKYEKSYGSSTYDKKVSEIIITPPINMIIARGTKQPAPAPKPVTPKRSSNCNPNYSGCVPNASDVDCAGGSGNGPAYVRGPVYVIGYDVTGLDRDNDGIGCE